MTSRSSALTCELVLPWWWCFQQCNMVLPVWFSEQVMLFWFLHSWILFQDITWQDEHSAPFSWETKVNMQHFYFWCWFVIWCWSFCFCIIFILILDRPMSPRFYGSCMWSDRTQMGQGWCTLIYSNKTTKCTFYTDVLTSSAGVELIHSKLFDFFFSTANFQNHFSCFVRTGNLIWKTCVSYWESITAFQFWRQE